jgi:hypothetical protein
MSIAVQVHDTDPAALADLIGRAMTDHVVIDPTSGSPDVAHISAVIEAEERELERRRVAWHWLNSLSPGAIDQDNDWSDV